MRVCILSPGSLPTIKYYVDPLIRFLQLEKAKDNCDIAFIVRYLDKNVIEKACSVSKRVVYILDDHILKVRPLLDLPPTYAWRLFRKAYLRKYLIRKHNIEVWVSTDFLADEYREYNSKVIYPYPLLSELPCEPATRKNVVFYHGTPSHTAEILWLKSVIEKVLSLAPNVMFELVLNDKLYAHYRDVKGIIPIRQMDFDSYVFFSSIKYRSVGLVPLLDTPFNICRSWTKFYDIVRAGAVGIYSEVFSISEHIKRMDAGVVLPMDKKLWVEAILDLVEDGYRRGKIYRNSLDLLDRLKQMAEDSYNRAVYGG